MRAYKGLNKKLFMLDLQEPAVLNGQHPVSNGLY